MIEHLAGWVAPIATMVAAMMTAANLGARVTGWGFVVFAIGSVAWSLVGVAGGQTNLLATNLFLTLVNGVGVWRWLGRQRVYEDGGKAAQKASRRSAAATLFTASGVAGMPVADRHGTLLGKAVDALLECDSGTISYVVVASGGIGGVQEVLRAVPRADIAFACETLTLKMDEQRFERLPTLEPGDWPAMAPAAVTETA